MPAITIQSLELADSQKKISGKVYCTVFRRNRGSEGSDLYVF